MDDKYKQNLINIFVLAMCLGLFGLLFLLFKLTAVPAIQFIQNRYFTSKEQLANNNEDDDNEIDQIIEEEIEKVLNNFGK
jgi:hypothetical protein